MNEEKKNDPGRELNFWGLGITILAILALVFFVDMSKVRTWVEQAGIWGPLLFILLKTSTIVIAPLSGSPLYPLVGLLFGFWPGILYVEIGDFLGYTISFFISRFFGKQIVAKFISDKEESILTRVMDHASTTKGFFQATLTLFAMPELLSYGAGLTKIKYWKFISIMLPVTIVGSSLFVYLGSILTSDSIFIGFGLPLLGIFAALIGGTLFAKSIKDKNLN